MDTQVESQWAAAQGLLSALFQLLGRFMAFGEIEIGCWELAFSLSSGRFRYPRNRMLRQVFRLRREVFAIPRCLRNFRGGTRNMSTQENESQCVAAQGLLLLLTTLPFRPVVCKSGSGFCFLRFLDFPDLVITLPREDFSIPLSAEQREVEQSWTRRVNLSGPQHEHYSRHLQFLR